MRRLITIIGVLSIATSAMAASVSYTDDWGSDGTGNKTTVGQGQGDWTKVASADSMFKADPTIPSGWTGNNLMLQAALGAKGIYNDLNDGDHASDPLSAGEYVGPTASENVKLSSAWRNYSNWGSASTQLTLTLSGPGHSISIINPGGGGDYDETNWYYQIDGGTVTDTGVLAMTGSSGAWDGIYIDVGLSAITIGVEAIGGNHPNGDGSISISGSYSSWAFDTITIECDGSACVRTGYIAAVTLAGEIVPEPATLALLGFGLTLVMRRRRR